MNESKKDEKDFWHGIPIEEIKWSPIIDYKKCIGCGLCVLNCPTFVFSYDFEKNIANVIKPYKCLVGCNRCTNLCIPTAIFLPSLAYLHDIMKKRDVFKEGWNKLEDNKYMYM